MDRQLKCSGRGKDISRREEIYLNGFPNDRPLVCVFIIAISLLTVVLSPDIGVKEKSTGLYLEREPGNRVVRRLDWCLTWRCHISLNTSEIAALMI